MATKPITMRFGVMEPPNTFKHTPVSRAFSGLLGLLGCYLEAERDIEHAAWADPAFADWLAEAEQARLAVLEGTADVLELQIVRPSDFPLRLTALVGQAMLQSVRPEEFAQLHGPFDRHAECFCTPGDDPVSRRVDRMLTTAKTRLDELAALSIGEDSASGPELPPGGC